MKLLTLVVTLQMAVSSVLAQTTGLVRLQWATFDPAAGVPAPPTTWGGDRDTHLWIVQSADTLDDAWRNRVRECGGEIHGYLPDQAHLIRATYAAADQIAALPRVRWIGPYHPAYRTEPELVAMAENGDLPPTARYHIVLVDKHTDRPELLRAVRELGGKIEAENEGSLLVEVSLTPEQLRRCARLDQTLWIDRVLPRAVDMNHARSQAGANHVETVGGYTGQGVRGHIYEGIEATHQDFTIQPLAVGSCSSANDHGHATAGIVFGNGTSHPNARGMAPDVTPFYTNDLCQNVGTSRWQIVQDLVQTHEVMFTTSSWGNGLSTTYTSITADADDIVFDHGIAWTQSMSNNGNQLARPQAWAKNLFSIGGVRHYDNGDPSDDSWSNGASRGPSADGRIKPDFCAYYDMTWTSDLSGAAGYGPDSHINDFGGTSGATPMVAGINALAIQMFTDGLFSPQRVPGGTRFQNRPNFTTLKALQIVGAHQYSFGATSSDNRREHQGWGFPNLKNLHDDRGVMHVVDETTPLTQGDVARYRIQVAPSRTSLKAAMTFADPAANPAAASSRINDLTLRAIAPDGTVYWGNHGLQSGTTSIAGGSRDNVDTVECIFVDQPMAGVWSFDVIADLVVADNHAATTQTDADFGLVVCGGSYVGMGTPGTTQSFGQGCQGSRPSPPETCLSLNDTANKTNVQVGADTLYAFEVTAPSTMDVTGFRLFANSRTTQLQTLSASIRYADSSGEPNTVVANGTMDLTTVPGWTTAHLPTTQIPAGQVFYVCVQTQPIGPSLWDATASGTDVPYLRLQNGSWSPRITGNFEWCIQIECQPGTTQTPQVHVTGIPDVGQGYQVQVDGLVSNELAAILCGSSRTLSMNSQIPLPYALGPLGGGTCTVYVGDDLLVLGTSRADGTFETSLSLPLVPAFIGTNLYHQGMVVDTAANSLGFVLSDAIHVTVGG
jgi:serine protease AprX